MFPYAQCVRHDRQRRIDGAAGAEETAVDDVKIIDVVGFAIDVQGTGPRIVAEANRANLMRYPSQRNPLSDVDIASEQAFMVCSRGRPWLASALARWLSFVKAVQERTKNP